MEYAMQEQFYTAHKFVNLHGCLVILNSTHVIGFYCGICNAGLVLQGSQVCKFSQTACNIE